MKRHLGVAGSFGLAGVMIAVAMSGCVAAGVSTSTTASTAVTSSGKASYQGIDSANVESVRMSVQVGPVPNVWVVDLSAAQAYIVTPAAQGSPATTGSPRPLSAAQVADFRAMLDAVDVWTWADWANANRLYAPAGNATVTLTSAGHTVFIDLGAPSVRGTDGSSHVLPGWTDFCNAVTALTGE